MSSSSWFVGRDGRQLGPYRLAALQELGRRGMLLPGDLVWTEGMSDWTGAESVDGLIPKASVTEPNLVSHDPPVGATRRANYLVRHWRGDLSLPVSYWINGTLLTALTVGLFYVLGESDFIKNAGALRSGVQILFTLALLWTVTLWQLVGTWRSADHSVSRGGSSGWATMAKVAVVIGAIRLAGYCVEQAPLLREGVRLVSSGDNTPAFQLHVVNRGTELEIAGGLSFGTADAVKSVLEATPSIRTVQLNNRGGRIAEGSRLADLIRSHKLSTYTARTCASACLLAFVAGQQRYLGTKGKLGFHQASVDGTGGEVASYGTQLMRTSLLGVGAPATFVDHALSISPKDIWYPSSEELVSAHIVTAIVDESQFAMTGVNGWQDKEKLRKAFSEISVFAAVRDSEPAAYGDLENIYVDGVQAGTPQDELDQKVRTVLVQRLVPKYMRIGPDAELVGYWKTQLSEAAELRDTDAKYCVAFLDEASPDNAKALSLISKDRQSTDIAALAALFRAGTKTPMPVPVEADVQPTIRAAARRAEQMMPGSVALVAHPDRGAKVPARLCGAELAFYQALLTMPTRESGPVLRYFAANN